MGNDEKGTPFRLIEILLCYLIKDGVYVISNSDALDYYALKCSFCSAPHLVDESSPFECQRCGSLDCHKLGA